MVETENITGEDDTKAKRKHKKSGERVVPLNQGSIAVSAITEETEEQPHSPGFQDAAEEKKQPVEEKPDEAADPSISQQNWQSFSNQC